MLGCRRSPQARTWGLWAGGGLRAIPGHGGYRASVHLTSACLLRAGRGTALLLLGPGGHCLGGGGESLAPDQPGGCSKPHRQDGMTKFKSLFGDWKPAEGETAVGSLLVFAHLETSFQNGFP